LWALEWAWHTESNKNTRGLFKNSLSWIPRVIFGVQQGSNLGLLLFTSFIYDLPSNTTHSRVRMNADDVKWCLYKDTSFQADLQSDFNNFQTWCSDNLLALNGSKCKVMTFCRVSPKYARYALSEGSLDRITLVNDL